MVKNLTFTVLQQVEYCCWFCYMNQLGKYGSVLLITFQTHWKENSLCIPLPFGNLPLSELPIP